ncbi:putative outer membrane protein [Flammeovirgaceae bacterium 311]|nr:putative outer membrane protein [Flammeovirgaceae bacterium 311]
MEKLLHIFFLALLFGLAALPPAHAQLAVSGRVLETKSAQPLPGVTVLVKGTSTGTVTDVDGRFSLAVPNAATVLVFSFVGYNVEEVPVGNNTTFTVSLIESVDQLEELVVTALGIEKDTRGLAYTTQQLGGEELTRAKDPNLMNSLAGKVAGVTINRSAAGVGGSVKVNIRGNRSASGANQPLYVIDGIPLLNSSPSQPLNAFGGDRNTAGRDGGDGIANLNPDDIESINVLKGASASALYGSQAANGVIVITTKRGKKGVSRIDFSSNVTMEQPILLQDFQRQYGQPLNDDGSRNTTSPYSWGPELSGNEPVVDVKDFFRTGTSLINSLAFTGGTEHAQTYFSYANTYSEGILPTSDFKRHNFTLRQSTQLFDSKLRIDANINYLTQKAHNRPTSGFYFNPLTGLYLFPRGADFNQYSENFEVENIERRLMGQNWAFQEPTQQNPYWILNRNASDDNRNRIIGSATLKYNILPWMNVQGRLSVDRISDLFTHKIHATSVITPENGRYIREEQVQQQFYGDLLLNVNQQFNNISLSATLGTSINDTHIQGETFDSYNEGLHFANVFTVANLRPGSTITEISSRRQLQAVFASAQLGYKDVVYLDLTGRNDWASTLAFTPNGSYFYPSVGTTFILNEMITMPAAVSLAKLRASYASVGNDVPLFVTNPTHYISPGGNADFNTEAPFTDLKPEISSSLEFGADIGLFNNRLALNLTYYNTHTENQFLRIRTSSGTLYSYRYINAGDIQNKGVEAMLNYALVKNDRFSWTAGLNFSRNKNEVLELSNELDDDMVILTEQGSTSYSSVLKVGGSFGDIYGFVLDRADNGSLYVTEDGTPVKKRNEDGVLELERLGNPNPTWQLGVNNNISYRGINLDFLIDARVGGEVVSLTQAVMDQYGVSQATAEARNAGGIDVPAIVQETGEPFAGKIPADKYYGGIAGRDGVSSEYVYSATNVRLRELALGYQFPASLGFVKNLQLSFVARNLFFLYNEAPYDPEISMSTGNNLQGVDIFGVPTTRSYGLNLKVSF